MQVSGIRILKVSAVARVLKELSATRSCAALPGSLEHYPTSFWTSSEARKPLSITLRLKLQLKRNAFGNLRGSNPYIIP